MSFEKFRQKHDPHDRKDWTFPFTLNDGEELAYALVQVVDSTSTNVDADTDLVIESTSFGEISGSQWGVTVWISGGGARDRYYLRCRIETDSSPISRKADVTKILLCAQQ